MSPDCSARIRLRPSYELRISDAHRARQLLEDALTLSADVFSDPRGREESADQRKV